MKVLLGPESLALFRDGDQVIFKKAFDEIEDRIYSRAFSYLGHSGEAEDIVLIVREKFWDKKATITNASHAEGFLLIVTSNECIKILRNRKKLPLVMGGYNDLLELQDPNDEDVQARERRKDMVVQHALAFLLEDEKTLPPNIKEVARLRLLEHLSFKEIAQLKGVSESTVRNQCAEARKRLAAALKELYSR